MKTHALVAMFAAVLMPVHPGVARDRGMAGPVQPFVLTGMDYARVLGKSRLTIEKVALSADRQVDLELEPFEVFAPDAQLVVVAESGEHREAPPPVTLWRGHVRSRPDSRVFLSVSPYGTNGIIELGTDQYISSSGRFGEAMPALIFDPQALPPGPFRAPQLFCRHDKPLTPARPPPSLPESPPGIPPRCIDLATETDTEFTVNLFSGNTTAAAAYVQTLIGTASFIYERDVNARFKITYLRLWTAADPWNGTATDTQLLQLQSYWQANQTSVVRNLVHMLSGRALGGGLSLDALCGVNAYSIAANLVGSFPYPLQDYNADNWDIYVVTHEIGHNFGSPHTHCFVPPIDQCGGPGADCPSPQICQRGTIMSYCHGCAPDFQGNTQFIFHPRCVNEAMAPYLNTLTTCGLESCQGEIWVDFNYLGIPQQGTYANPYRTLTQGVSAVPTNGTIIFKPGNSGPLTFTSSRAMTWRSYAGTVIIGQ